jgi:fucose permease
MSDWIAPQLQLVGGVDAGTAARVASLYGLALTAGRALGIFVLHRVGMLRVLAVAISVAVLGAALIVLAGPTVGLIAVGVLLVGVGFSPVYPTVIALAGQQQPENRGAVTGFVAGIGAIGAMIIPVIQGWVGGGHSGGMIVTLVAALIMVGALIQIQVQFGRVRHAIAAQ